MKLISRIFNSSLGKKYLMALTGLVLFLFVAGHLAGNLQIFLGREAINRYGHFLQSNPELIWPVRLFLLLMVGLHIWSAIQLTLENRAARPLAYGQYNPVGSTYASRTMLVGGLIVLAFIVYHLLHYTVKLPAINLTGKDFAGEAFREVTRTGVHQHDVYAMMVAGFSNVWVSAFYILGMGLLCLHLSHGLSSMFQSLGWKNNAWRPCLDRGARIVAVLIFIGYSSIPVAILLGFGRETLK
jgi:succinate dehydrogenase / fumarate reductase cytochrome b subunit